MVQYFHILEVQSLFLIEGESSSVSTVSNAEEVELPINISIKNLVQNIDRKTNSKQNKVSKACNCIWLIGYYLQEKK